MYIQWFKLNKLPFRLRPDPEFLYLDGEIAIAYEGLRAAAPRGMVCLLGETGVGKTTLLHALAREREQSMCVARIQQPDLTSEELAAALAEQFRLPLQEGTTLDPWGRLDRFVAEQSGRGRGVMVLVDQAHRCSSAVLGQLLQIAARPPAPLIILAGEEALLKLLSPHERSGTTLRIMETLRIPRLNHAQVADYLNYRLSRAGSEGRELFDPDTVVEIMRYTGGTPQLINIVCDSAMALAAAHSAARVGVVEIRDAVQELNWVEFSARGAPAPSTDTPIPNESGSIAPNATRELVLQRDGEFVSRVVLTPGRCLVGRAPEADLRLDSKFVSRKHCQIVTSAREAFVEDLGSNNGIFVNGHRHRFYRLASGDQILVGDFTLTYLDTSASAGA
jgi:general secretion pathway protein A